MGNELLSAGVRALLAELHARGGQVPVAFDADGTLWRGDVGEDLLRWLDAERFGDGSAFAEYERRCATDPRAGYAFAVEVLAGIEEAAVTQLCEERFGQAIEERLHGFVRPLFDALERAGAEVWIVSGSPVWAVLPGAARVGVSPERVIAARCEVANGRLTGKAAEVPCAEEKAALLQARGVRPFFAAGNSPLDVPMLEHAERAIWVAPVGDEGPHVKAALARGWALQRG